MVSAKDIMHKHIVGISKSTKADAALRLAEASKVELIPVLEGQKLCGIVMIDDLQNQKHSNATAGEFMRNPVYVLSTDSVDDVSTAMIKHSIGRIPVVDSKKGMVCIGYITSTDVVNAAKK